MERSSQPRVAEGRIDSVGFARRKYGQELLIDVAWIRDMPGFNMTPRPYRLDFYDITLISRGRGDFYLDSERHTVRANTVFFTSPGQTRRWLVDDLDGLCLFFPAEFLLEHFNDPLFLHRLRFFHNNFGPLALPLLSEQKSKLLERLSSMQQEIGNLKNDSTHLLRAIAYEILINLNRWYAKQYSQQLDSTADHKVARFRQMVELEYKKKQRVSHYASELSVTPGHLNYLCQQHLGRSASNIIHARVISEAKRLLVLTDYDVGYISDYLGFVDPSYFSRVFKRSSKLSPLAYRKQSERELLEVG